MEKVIMYGDPSCPKCQQAEEYLNNHHVEYRYLNVAEDPKAREKLFHLSDTQGVPTFEIGKEVVVGFNEEKLEKLLN